ncbi:hypothetical protein ACFVVA_41870 [Kitasatospora sp. NPDC058048]|uniref:hypothetical protein n=1 Tax=Kitasatospora sp. NPDC058048 TaxID=3346313 RepID=UPI0036D799EE
MADQPIEPTRVVLAGERDGATPPPPPPSEPPTVGMPDAFLPPPRRGGGAPPPPPSGPPPGFGGPAGGAPEPWEPWRKPGGRRGGGVATAPAPVYAPPVEVHHHYYPAAPAPAAPAAPRFDVRRIHPVANSLAAATGVVLARGPVNEAFHWFSDPIGLPVCGLAVAGVLEWCWHRYRGLCWLARVFTFTMAASTIITPAGQQLISYLMTQAAW